MTLSAQDAAAGLGSSGGKFSSSSKSTPLLGCLPPATGSFRPAFKAESGGALTSALLRTNSDGVAAAGSGPKAAAANRLASTAPANFAQSTPLSSGSGSQQQQQQQQQSEAGSMSGSTRPFVGLKGAAQRPTAAAQTVPAQTKPAGGKGFTVDDDYRAAAAAPAAVMSQSTAPLGRAAGAGGGLGAAPQRVQKPPAAGAAPAAAAAAAEEEIAAQLQALTITATSWTHREAALLALNDLLSKRAPTPLQVERTVDAVAERLADPHPKVACACIAVLHTLLQAAPVPLSPRIDLLLPRVFGRASEAKRATAGAAGCPQEAAFGWLAAVRDVVPPDVLLPHLLRCTDAPQLPLRGRLLALDMLASSATNHRCAAHASASAGCTRRRPRD